MAKNIIYTCDVCGNQSSHRVKVKAKCLKSIRQMTEYGAFYNSLKWVKIDLCEDCYGRMISEVKHANKSTQHEAIWRPTDFEDLYACSNCSNTEIMTYKDMTRYYCSRCGYAMTNATELKEQLKRQHRDETMVEPKIPSDKKMAKEIVNKALDKFEYKGMTIRQWANKITNGKYVPIVHGQWINEYLGYGVSRYRCSRCGSTFGEDQIIYFKHKNYCADCGAKMDGKENL